MLRDEDIRIDIGRAAHGGDCMRMVHLPTGISRLHPGPLRGLDIRKLQRTWRKEIEDELTSKGLTQHILPDPPPRSCSRHL